MPKNTEASTKWVITNLIDWFHVYNEKNPEKKCPDEVILPICSVTVLSKWLCVNVTRAKNNVRTTDNFHANIGIRVTGIGNFLSREIKLHVPSHTVLILSNCQ